MPAVGASDVSWWTIFIIALGVSADAFAAALASGVRVRRLSFGHALTIALVFGAFQAVMPLLGWLLASRFTRVLEPVDHWVAFGLLTLIGLLMIREALSDTEVDQTRSDGLELGRLLLLGVATSIDAAAVGLSFAVLDVAILPAIALIGATTLVVALLGVFIGHRLGIRFRGPAEVVGGVVLIAVGTRILLGHLGIL